MNPFGGTMEWSSKKRKKQNISLRFLYENSFKIELCLLQEAEALSRQAEAEFENTEKI